MSVVCATAAAAQNVIYVDATQTMNPPDGMSWPTAYDDLEDALSIAGTNDQIWVADGTYLPSNEQTPGDPRSATFLVPASVALYGGFAGNEAMLADRAELYRQTILSGDVALTPMDNSDDVYHVVFCDTGSPSFQTRVDGFTIQSGNADSATFPDDRGGGLYADGIDLRVEHCFFEFNFAEMFGGGMCYDGGAGFGDVRGFGVSQCSFTTNFAGRGGGGLAVFNFDELPTEAVVDRSWIFNSSFARNLAGEEDDPDALPCLSPPQGGGAIFVGDRSGELDVCNTRIYGNLVRGYGSAFYSVPSPEVRLSNCTVTENNVLVAPAIPGTPWFEPGGAVHIEPTPGVVNEVSSCILWMDNDAPTNEPIVELVVPANTLVRHCDVDSELVDTQGNPYVYPGDGNLNADPLFVNPLIGNFQLQVASPCIDVGSDSLLTTDRPDLDGDFDLDEPLPREFLVGIDRVIDSGLPGPPPGNSCGPTLLCGVVDMGAHEADF